MMIMIIYLTPTRKPDLMLINKKKEKNLSSCGFCRSGRSQIENKKRENVDKYLDLARELRKALVHEGDGDTNCSYGCKVFKGEEVRRTGNQTIQTKALLKSARILRRVLRRFAVT